MRKISAFLFHLTWLLNATIWCEDSWIAFYVSSNICCLVLGVGNFGSSWCIYPCSIGVDVLCNLGSEGQCCNRGCTYMWRKCVRQLEQFQCLRTWVLNATNWWRMHWHASCCNAKNMLFHTRGNTLWDSPVAPCMPRWCRYAFRYSCMKPIWNAKQRKRLSIYVQKSRCTDCDIHALC